MPHQALGAKEPPFWMQIYIYLTQCKWQIQFQVGWSRTNLVKKLEENPNGVTLVLKRLPGFLKRKESRAKSEVLKAHPFTIHTYIHTYIKILILNWQFSSMTLESVLYFLGLFQLCSHWTHIWFGYQIRSFGPNPNHNYDKKSRIFDITKTLLWHKKWNDEIKKPDWHSSSFSDKIL